MSQNEGYPPAADANWCSPLLPMCQQTIAIKGCHFSFQVLVPHDHACELTVLTGALKSYDALPQCWCYTPHSFQTGFS
jgi:hypothetical protein